MVRHAALAILLVTVHTNPALAQTPRPDGHGKAKLDEFNRALGVECSHCHVPDQWQDDSKPPKATARKMIEMVPLLNEKLRGVGEVACWTCHRGQVQPSRVTKEAMDAELARWPAKIADASQATKMTMAVYSASTGLRCAQCHDVTNWKSKSTDKIKMVPRMLSLFAVMQPYIPPERGAQCFTCHKGANKPERNP
jgi:Photosynthetic reaction centre cytochrome C subunit